VYQLIAANTQYASQDVSTVLLVCIDGIIQLSFVCLPGLAVVV